jgi:hypothetical protein
MPRKIRAKVEEKVDETKIMNVLDAMPVKVVEPIVEPVIVKEQKQPKAPKQPKEQKEQKQPKEQKEQKQPKEQKEQKQRAPNAWLEFLKEYRMKHPEKSYKECLQDGKSEYKQ